MSEAESQGGSTSLPQIPPHILAPPGYMDLKKKQNSMYLGKESEKKILMCSSGGGGGPAQKKNLDNFFQHVKKLLNFWNFVNMKVAKHSVKPFGFLLRKLVFFDRKIRKVRN